MQTTITARHVAVSDALRQRAMTIVERVGHLAHRPVDMTVVFDEDGLDQTAELRLHLARGERLIARGSGRDHRTALDRAEAKLRSQIERVSTVVRRLRTRPLQVMPRV